MTSEIPMEVIESAKIEASKQESTPVDPLDTPELNQAAYTFQTSIPKIKSLSKNMSRNSLARVFSAIMEFPLAEKYPKFRHKVENELFILSLAAISAKNVMTSAFVGNNQEAIIQEAENAVVQELLEESKKEEANG